MKKIAGGRTYLGIDVFDELVEILEPFIGILELKVAAHGHDDVVGGEASSLK